MLQIPLTKMNQESDLQSRIQQIEEYITLGKKLEEIIDEQKALQIIQTVLESLGELQESYEKQVLFHEQIKKLQSKKDEIRESFVRDYAHELGGEENARHYFGTPANNPIKEAYIDLAKGIGYGLVACIVAPFSRDISKLYLKAKTDFFTLSKNFSTLINTRREYAKTTEKRLKVLHDYKFTQARLADRLKTKVGLTDDALIEQILEKQELLYYSILEMIREKYVPWL